jgi:hypothetical protein
MVILTLLRMPGLRGNISQHHTLTVLPAAGQQIIAHCRLDSNFDTSRHTNVVRHDTVICELLIPYQNISCGRRTSF